MSKTATMSERIFEVRDERGWSQRRLAAESGISQTTIVHLETGQITEPRRPTLRRIARALDMTVEELLEGVDAPKADRPSFPSSGAEGRLASSLVGERDRLKALADRWERELGEEIKTERDALFAAAGRTSEFATIADGERLYAVSLAPDPDDELPEWESYLRRLIQREGDRLTRLKFEAYSRIDQAVEAYPSPEERAQLHEEIAEYLGAPSGDQAHA